jgi:hypothetical protein
MKVRRVSPRIWVDRRHSHHGITHKGLSAKPICTISAPCSGSGTSKHPRNGIVLSGTVWRRRQFDSPRWHALLCLRHFPQYYPASECTPSTAKEAVLRALIHNLREFPDLIVVLQNIVPHSMMFQMPSLTLPLSVNWIGLAEPEIQEFWMISFLEIQLPELVEARNENDGTCHDDDIWSRLNDWKKTESELQINTGR